MTNLLLSVGTAGGLIGLLIYVAIAVVVLWAIWQLILWLGIPIPRPVQIVLIALICIAAIVLLARAFGYFI